MLLKGTKASEKITNSNDEINVIDPKKTVDAYKKTVNKLSKERDHYRQGFGIYREEAKQWKAKYLRLQLSIQILGTVHKQMISNIHTWINYTVQK